MPDEIERRSIREWRERVFFMNQAEFAEKVGVDVSTLSLWETGKRRPRPKGQRLVAEALGLRPEQLLFDFDLGNASPSGLDEPEE